MIFKLHVTWCELYFVCTHCSDATLTPSLLHCLQHLCCLCRNFEHTGVLSAFPADWTTLSPALPNLILICCKCKTFLQYTDVMFLLLQPWTRSLPPRSIWCHLEGQLWHPHPSSAVRAVLQNLCPEGAQIAVFCQEEGQCQRYKHAQAHA